MKYICTLFFALLLFASCDPQDPLVGQTEITKWQGNKSGAVSITFDDGIINQLTIAKPILDSLDLKGTFYIITGKVEGSGKGKFIGRDPQEIINETAQVPTDSSNLFERASLIAYTGTSEAVDYHSRIGSLYEQGKVEEAYSLTDEGYAKIRNGQMKDTDDIVFHDNVEDTTTWDQYRFYSAQGHEIASHTVTHPRLAVLDEVNLKYELEQSKADLLKFIGEESIFSAECPYGTENERVMSYAHQVYHSLRNRMPEDWLEEINRGSRLTPGQSEKEYVQWQRGPLTRTSTEEAKSWADTVMNHDNTWLVLVYHGVENLGWEPKKREELVEYFSYLKAHEDQLWIAPFRNVTKYLRERKATTITTEINSDEILLNLTCSLDAELYQEPLTLKTYVPKTWSEVAIAVDEEVSNLQVMEDEKGKFVIYSALPNAKNIRLAKSGM